MLNNIQNIVYSFKKPKIILIFGKDKTFFSETIFFVLNKYLKVKRIKGKIRISDFLKNKILILESEMSDFKNLELLIKNSELPILVVTDADGADLNFEKMFQNFSSPFFLLFNFDNDKIKNLKEKIQIQSLNFGLAEGADFRATDIKMNGGVNFKINYKGNTVPFWLEKSENQGKIYSALAAAGVGEILKLNLLKISEALKNHQ